MTLYFFGLPVWVWYWRAILIANSLASEPPVANLTVLNCSGVMSERSWASLIAGGFVDMVGALKRELAHLGGGDISEMLDPVTEVDRENAGETVDVFLAVDVPDADAGASFEDERVVAERFHLIEIDHDFGSIKRFGVGHVEVPLFLLDGSVANRCRDCRIGMSVLPSLQSRSGNAKLPAHQTCFPHPNPSPEIGRGALLSEQGHGILVEVR